jgi:hypothetical protein
MSHHTWKSRFKTALKNKNWKKIFAHEIIEWSWIGSWLYALESSQEAWIIGLAGAVFIHLIVFEFVDSLHKQGTHTHKYMPKWLHWIFDADSR